MVLILILRITLSKNIEFTGHLFEIRIVVCGIYVLLLMPANHTAKNLQMQIESSVPFF